MYGHNGYVKNALEREYQHLDLELAYFKEQDGLFNSIGFDQDGIQDSHFWGKKGLNNKITILCSGFTFGKAV